MSEGIIYVDSERPLDPEANAAVEKMHARAMARMLGRPVEAEVTVNAVAPAEEQPAPADVQTGNEE